LHLRKGAEVRKLTSNKTGLFLRLKEALKVSRILVAGVLLIAMYSASNGILIIAGFGGATLSFNNIFHVCDHILYANTCSCAEI
jgi:hypothetical protein